MRVWSRRLAWETLWVRLKIKDEEEDDIDEEDGDQDKDSDEEIWQINDECEDLDEEICQMKFQGDCFHVSVLTLPCPPGQSQCENKIYQLTTKKYIFKNIRRRRKEK